jgi:hypothetical protein
MIDSMFHIDRSISLSKIERYNNNNNKIPQEKEDYRLDNPTVYLYHNKASYQWSDRRLAWEKKKSLDVQRRRSAATGVVGQADILIPVHLYSNRGSPEE